MSDKADVVLQVNLSPGDVAYAKATVAGLVATHRPYIKSTLAVVDCCKPQRTIKIDPERDYPEPRFSKRADEICAIARELQSEGVIDRTVVLRPGDEILRLLERKYLSGVIGGTHDAKGTPILAYLAPLEVAEERYVLHFDADMLLHQAPGYSWLHEAIERMSAIPRAVIATPRVSPPFAGQLGRADATSLHDGPQPELVDGGWLINWFSTRCLLMDRERLAPYVPILRGKLLVEVLARRLLKRNHPLALEEMLCQRIGGSGGRRLDLATEQAWILHPDSKGERFLRMLPALMDAVAAGEVPIEQRGLENVQLEAWERFLAARARQA